MKSQRKDGRGHWPTGKHRSTLTAAQRARIISRLRRAILDAQSMRAVARTLGISDRSVRRILGGEDQPTERIRRLVASRFPGR